MNTKLVRSIVSGPDPRKRHHSFDESLDEPAKLLEDEATDVEEERPAEENEPVEQVEKPDPSDSSAFEEE
jgi:hypothetical protein